MAGGRRHLRVTQRTVLTALLVSSVALAVAGPQPANFLRAHTRWLLAPLGDAGMYISTTGRRLASRVSTDRLTPQEIEELQEENERLWNTVVVIHHRMAEFQERHEAMKALYGRLDPVEFECELVAGRVVGTGSLPYAHGRTINVGSTRGAQAGARVLTRRRLLTDRGKALPTPQTHPANSEMRFPSGLATLAGEVLVGWVVGSWAYGAELQLVTDNGFQTNAYVLRDLRRQRQIRVVQQDNASEQLLTWENNELIPVLARGDGAEYLVVRDVKGDDRIQPGDLLLTRGDSYFLPERLPIGLVEEVQDQPQEPGFVTLLIKPLADLSTLRDVYVVVPTSPGGGN